MNFSWRHISIVLIFTMSISILADVENVDYTKYDVSNLTSEEAGNYVVGSIDQTDITPKTWLVIRLIIEQANGSESFVNLLRPVWWFQKYKPKVNGYIYLSLPEIGILGNAKVLAIRKCNVDSRNLVADKKIVTGKFVHDNANVWKFVFEDSLGKKETLNITPGHPIYSKDRNAWVAASQLKIKEHVETNDNKNVYLISRHEILGKHRVYNLEVHKSHSFYVSKFKILSHNTCALNNIEEKLNIVFVANTLSETGVKAKKVKLEGSELTAIPITNKPLVLKVVKHLRDNYLELGLTPKKKFKANKMCIGFLVLTYTKNKEVKIHKISAISGKGNGPGFVQLSKNPLPQLLAAGLRPGWLIGKNYKKKMDTFIDKYKEELRKKRKKKVKVLIKKYLMVKDENKTLQDIENETEKSFQAPNGDLIDRFRDAEMKMYLDLLLFVEKENIKGKVTIDMFTEFDTCPSCAIVTRDLKGLLKRRGVKLKKMTITAGRILDPLDFLKGSKGLNKEQATKLYEKEVNNYIKLKLKTLKRK